jgi:UDP:flavonoid glycosyltransferase YjiC (YdhE family)
VRLLLGAPAGLAHLLPVVPLAWAARAAGHEVRVVTCGASARASLRAGLSTVDLAPGRHDAQHVPLDRHAVERAAGAIAAWRPDLVVHTAGDPVGPAVAARLAVPLVLHGLGLPPNGPGPVAVLDTCPPSLREPGRRAAWPMRYVPYSGGGALPDWLLRPEGSRPRVCVTMGTVLPRVAGAACVAPILAGLRGLDLEVVLLLGDAGPSGAGELPENVVPAGWLPLTEVLPGCRALVHHGGAGTTMTAVAAGVPQLVVDFRDAAAIERRGIGLVVPAHGIEPAAVRAGVLRLLDEPSFAAAAREVREENAAQPEPSAVVEDLRRLASGTAVAS